ncbi:MAG: hypothetical protein EKK47_17410 [Burkholderiales bacterium]|nr:MAG: hypothetical protein EKK47_17410 [Burkholderiales bacterium]
MGGLIAVMGKRLWLVLWTVFVLVGHLLFDAHTLYQEALSQQSGAYRLSDRRLTDRVVLVVLDSWAERTLADGHYMPKLFARQQSGAHGVLWAPRQTATIHGILSLSTGRSPSGLAAIGLMSSSRFEGWTIFDDVAARGENVSFHGGPAWLPLFGDRGQGHFRETGHGPNFRDEDMEGLRHSRQALLSGHPPALSVVHITETDVAAHQYGTERPEYATVLKFWDDALDDYLQQVLAKPGTTVVITADHGNDLNGSHGGSETIYRRVPVVFLGQGIAHDPHIEMNAADMPATIAVLLGVRAPSGAVALPAAHALQLSTVERGRVVLTAYFHSLLNRAALKERPEWLAKARRALPTNLDESHVDKLSEPEVMAMLPGVMSTFRELEEHVGLVRMMSGVDWAFVATTFLLSVLMLWSVEPATGAIRPPDWSGVLTMAGLVLLIELLFGVRITQADALKGWLHGGGRASLMMLAGGVAAAGLLIGAIAWRLRARLLHAVHAQRFLLVVLAYLLTSVLYPVNTMGLMVAMLLAAWLWQSPMSPTTRWRFMVLGLAVLLVSTKVWTLLGESVPPRMAVGTSLAVLVAGLMVWASRRMAIKPGFWPAAMGLALLLSPFSCFNVLDLTTQSQLILATVIVLVLAGWAWRISAGDNWLVWPLLPVLWFWWSGVSHAWGLYVALALGAGLAVIAGMAATVGANLRTSRHARLLVAMLGLLLTLSAPLHVPSLMGFLLVVLAFFQWRPTSTQRWPAVAMAAVLLVAARYGLFDFYGYADSPLQVYALKHLDLAAAYLGDDSRSILGAVLMVVFKIWLAGAVLMLAAAFVPHWRVWLDDVMTVGAVFLLIQVAQSAVRASLAFDDRSHQYDFAAFSMLVHTGMLILSLLAYAPLRRFFRDEGARVSAS